MKNSKVADTTTKNVAAKNAAKKSTAKKGAAIVKNSKKSDTAKKVVIVKKSTLPVKKIESVITSPQADTKTKKVFRSMKTIITNSTNGKLQQRSVGSRRSRNNWGHFEGTIGAKIDNMISKENFTKKQIEAFAGTKMSKVNSHINHLRKEKGFKVSIDAATKIVKFG